MRPSTDSSAATPKLTRNWHYLRTTVALFLPSVFGMEVMAAMEAKPTRWNDDRLDEFAANVDRRFDQVDKRFDHLDGRMDSGFNRLNDRLDDLMRVLISGFIGLIGVLLVGILSLIAMQL
jgi:hypothetical protein